MSAKGNLRKIGKIDLEVEKLLEEILKTETRLTKITTVLNDMPMAHGDTGKIPNGVSDLIDYKEKLARRISVLIQTKKEALEIIYKMNDDRLRTILIGHYLNGDTLVKLSNEMNYEYNYLCYLHKLALKEFGRIVDNHDLS